MYNLNHVKEFIKTHPLVWKEGTDTHKTRAIMFCHKQIKAESFKSISYENLPQGMVYTLPVPIEKLYQKLKEPLHYKKDFYLINDQVVIFLIIRHYLFPIYIGPQSAVVLQGHIDLHQEVYKGNVEKEEEEVFDCCICLDEFSKMSWKCKVCKAGLICGGCKKKMGKVHSCPVCRS